MRSVAVDGDAVAVDLDVDAALALLVVEIAGHRRGDDQNSDDEIE
jgi:hypothetical protein